MAKRFLTPDGFFFEQPEKVVGSPIEGNLYGYAGNDPVNKVDQEGNQLSFAEHTFKTETFKAVDSIAQKVGVKVEPTGDSGIGKRGPVASLAAVVIKHALPGAGLASAISGIDPATQKQLSDSERKDAALSGAVSLAPAGKIANKLLTPISSKLGQLAEKAIKIKQDFDTFAGITKDAARAAGAQPSTPNNSPEERKGIELRAP